MKKKQIKFKKMEMTIFTLIVLIVTALIFVYGIVKLFFEKTVKNDKIEVKVKFYGKLKTYFSSSIWGI